jgi:hypothetical protein
MLNILNMCEWLDRRAKEEEAEDFELVADSLRHYYLLSKRLEKRIAELEKNNG